MLNERAQRLKKAIPSVTDVDRVRTLHALEILDTLPEPDLDELTQLAARICATPMSLITLVDENRTWIKSAFGSKLKQCDREVSFCDHVIQHAGPIVVPDTRHDERFCRNPLVTPEDGIRFYAGVPLQAPNGHILGSLCVFDTRPRQLNASQQELLEVLARQIEARIALRAEQLAVREVKKKNDELAKSLRQSNNLFRAFMNHGPFLSYIKDADGRFVFYNDQVAEQFNITRDEWLGKTDFECFPREQAEMYRANDLMVLESGDAMELAEVTVDADNEVQHWCSHKFPFCPNEHEMMVAGMSLDVTKELQRQQAIDKLLVEKDALAKNLDASRSLFHAFANQSPMLAFVKTADGKYMFYNDYFAEYFGIDQQEWLGKSDDDVLEPGTAEAIRDNEHHILTSGERTEQLIKLPDMHGVTRSFKLVKFSYRGADGIQMLGGVATDVTEEINRQHELAEANRRLDALAATDPLTGLPNRRAFQQRISREFNNALRTRRPLALMVMDIDNFKKRNDQMGHAAGDAAIQLVGQVLAACGRDSDMPARVGGEEFCFLMPETTVAGAMQVAQRIQRQLETHNSGPLPLTVSIGIARMNRTIKTHDRLIACADDAMYEAKRAGKNCIVAHHEHVLHLLTDLAHKSGVHSVADPSHHGHDPRPKQDGGKRERRSVALPLEEESSADRAVAAPGLTIVHGKAS